MTQKAHSFGDVLFSLQRKKREIKTSQTEKNCIDISNFARYNQFKQRKTELTHKNYST